jgi:hypothetical protein
VKVCTIGCGPSGLAAAHAAVGLGADVTVIAPKRKTPQNGPIFLNTPIPGISTDHPHGYIKQIVIGGSIVDYGIKLYGDVNIAITRDGRLREGIHTWDIREAYDKMWSIYEGLIVDGEVLPREVDSLCKFYDLVISTAPIPSLCMAPEHHSFLTQEVAMIPKAAYEGQPENTTIYNAYPNIPWVRSSRMFGHEATEYMINHPPKEPYRIIKKPIRTDCDCHPRVFRTGRFGKWNNMAWIDSAYYDARTIILSMKHQHEWDAVK